MVLTRRNTRFFWERLYRGESETVTLLKRQDDQAEGTFTSYQLFKCVRFNISKSGEAIAGDQTSSMNILWILPSAELNRVGVNYINMLDRIVDKYNMWWQAESDTNITMAIFDNYFLVQCHRIDPFPNGVLIGLPGIGL